MPIFNTFAKRKRAAENAEEPVIYTQDHLPEAFRTQVLWILRDLIGFPQGGFENQFFGEPSSQFWRQARDTLAAEFGKFSLVSGTKSPAEDCLNFILTGQDVDDVLSVIEFCFDLAERTYTLHPHEPQKVVNAIAELNQRFLEHSIGYQYLSGRIISFESQYIHKEAVEPAIALLHETNFTGPLQEFLEAHAHYRKGEIKEAITDAGNAFESTMKAICDGRGWAYDDKRSIASTLIGILFDNQLIPREMQSHFTALRATLESGVPTVRNPGGRGAHGQGIEPVDVPHYVAAYCLNLTASNIVLMMEAHKSSARN